MPRNKAKLNIAQKEVKINEKSIQKLASKEQRVKNLVDKTNEFMYESLQKGKLNIIDPQQTARTLIRQSNRLLVNQIKSGDFQVSIDPTPYTISTKKLKNHLKIDEQLQDCYQISEKIVTHKFSQPQSLNTNLKQLHQSILQQKQLSSNLNKRLEQKARLFVVKMKKDKNEFEQKLKSNRQQSRVFVRAFTQDTIISMKNKLEQRLLQKKIKLSQKVQNIQKRKAERLSNEFNQEVAYWQKVRHYKSLKQLSKREDTERESFPLIKMTKCSSAKSIRQEFFKDKILLGTNEKHERNSMLNQKFKDIDNYVIKAKLKLQNFNSKINHEKDNFNRKSQTRSQLDNYSDLFIFRKPKNMINPELEGSNLNESQKLRVNNKQKKQKNLKEVHITNSEVNTLKKIKIKQSEFSRDENLNLNDNLQVNASIIKPRKHPIQIALENQWNQILNKIFFHSIDKLKGLSLLSEIEKKLDKYDKGGIIFRLKRKVQVIDNLQCNVNSLSNQNQNDPNYLSIQHKQIHHSCPNQEETFTKDDNYVLSSQNQFILNQPAIQSNHTK